MTMFDSPHDSFYLTHTPQSKNAVWRFTLILSSVFFPIIAVMLVYQLDSFEPAPIPLHKLTQPPVATPLMLEELEYIGVGIVKGPEDLLYDIESRIIYTGCQDGWIKRVRLNDSVADSVVEDWIDTGGRPLGLALASNGIIVADAYKGLLLVTENSVDYLSDEVDGKKFNITDGVDVAEDGMIYFTDASYKYDLDDYVADLVEGEPHGRLMSYDPVTKTTKLLASDLYFPNGLAISPDQTHVIFCETPKRRCRKCYIKGQNSGKVENFIDHLPGMPDNIHYDGHGHYWIALATEVTRVRKAEFRYPFVRKIAEIMNKYIRIPISYKHKQQDGGVMAVDLEGKPKAEFRDYGLSLISSGIKINDCLYCGSIYYPYIIRLNASEPPPRATV